MIFAMSPTGVGRSCMYRRAPTWLQSPIQRRRHPALAPAPVVFLHILAPRRRAPRCPISPRRTFTSSSHLWGESKRNHEEKFGPKLGRAWRDTKIEWKPIPVGLGIAFLGFLQFLRIQAREDPAQDVSTGEQRPPRRARTYPSGGGWQVQIMSTLPLKAISRAWGKYNELTIPYYLRVPGFKLYGWIFGVNFDEIAEPDLHNFPNLASFFYRELKPGLRPLDPSPNAVLSPADARVLQFGTIENGEVEQVKGITYKLDALLGQVDPSTSPYPQSALRIPPSASHGESSSVPADTPDAQPVAQDEEFARLNGISYTLPNFFSGSQQNTLPARDASTVPLASSEAAVSAELATTTQPWWSPFSSPSHPTKLYYIVIYLAPGDYHRFHSPVSWVCTSRRHFAGELYSVSPYVQRTLPGLFTLNERAVLLGRWRHGFFSYTPVGATNVGSIVINFDKELRTNSLTTDTEADRQAALAAERGEPYSGFSEASYTRASPVLGGHALRRGEEMGGFKLGSSIVLVFEAPAGEKRVTLNGEGKLTPDGMGGFRWAVEKGQRVKVGQALGYVLDEE